MKRWEMGVSETCVLRERGKENKFFILKIGLILILILRVICE
jgi:hypothetical protein